MIRVGVVGVGVMGYHHARVYSALEGCDLVGVHDLDEQRSEEAATAFACRAFRRQERLLDEVEAVSVAVPTNVHHEVGVQCLAGGCDVLIEKPMATSIEEADDLIVKAERDGRILQIGHVERYNPVVEALTPMVERPGFIEVDRLGSFAPRGLEVDVVLDLMIHDIDVIHGLFDDPVTDIRAAGVAVLSDEVDIANARLEFAGGCIANITASRVSVNRIRKVRIFQPETYFSADYSAQTLDRFELVRGDDGGPSISAQRLELPKVEPLVRELEDFVRCVGSRGRPRVDGSSGRRALQTALGVRSALGSRNRRPL